MTHYQLAQVYGQLKDNDKRKQHLDIFARLTKERERWRIKKIRPGSAEPEESGREARYSSQPQTLQNARLHSV